MLIIKVIDPFTAPILLKIWYFSRIFWLKAINTFFSPFTHNQINSRSMNEIKNLQYLPRTSEPREVLFEDRTRAHADHVGQGFDWQSTAAVGVLKAVQFGEW